MEYRGYTASVMFDDEAEAFHGRVQHLRDVVTFESDSVDGLKREFRISVDDYLEFCQELGQEPERPYSGRFVLRLDPELHRDAVIAADRLGRSLNSWIATVLSQALLPTKPGRRSGAA
jgi:predicted HicB family RNase H-like nuclease